MSIFEEEIIFNATVIAAIIGVIGSLMVAGLKTFFDWKNEKMRAKLNLDAQEQAYNQRISEKMIDRVHKYAAKYYFPLLRRADDFNQSLMEMGKNANDKTKRASFFLFVLYIKAQHMLFNDVGGVLLNSLDLEWKITELIYFSERKININLQDTNFLINKVKVVDYASFDSELVESYRNNSMFWKIYEKYEGNMLDKKTRDDLSKSLTAFFEIFVYGINMVFYPWYGEKPKPPVEGEVIYQKLKLSLYS